MKVRGGLGLDVVAGAICVSIALGFMHGAAVGWLSVGVSLIVTGLVDAWLRRVE